MKLTGSEIFWGLFKLFIYIYDTRSALNVTFANEAPENSIKARKNQIFMIYGKKTRI